MLARASVSFSAVFAPLPIAGCAFTGGKDVQRSPIDTINRRFDITS
jgi:hypothetical protein